MCEQVFLSRFLLSVFSLICLLWNSPVLAESGEKLAKNWCSSCHSFPEPQLLDKKTWIDKVLPDMGARLGFKTFRDGSYRPNSKVPDGVYATEPLMEMAEWEQIKSWYEDHAPEQLALPDWQNRTRLEQFGIEMPRREKHGFPATTAILIDEVSNRLLVGDAHETDLKTYGKDLALLNEVRSGGIVSRILPLPLGGYLATAIGGTISPTEDAHGLLFEVATGKERGISRLVRGLRRPVDVAFGDFNKDGETDYVIAGFGTHFGKLTLHLSQGDGALRETVLLDEAGAISVKVVGDDLLVLMAQGDERIVRLKSFANGQPVIAETIIRFPPSQGSSSMSVRDFNGDGIMDLLYTAGDNADISPVYKPYHGVYLFTGQRDNTFRQEMFFHLDGAYGAVAEDFDQDGDMDIAAISYFPNIGQGLDETGFVYLENNDGDFDPKYIVGIGKPGRFVAISAGDIDGDGDADIALANLAFGPPGPMEISSQLQEQWYGGTGFVLLRNNLR